MGEAHNRMSEPADIEHLSQYLSFIENEINHLETSIMTQAAQRSTEAHILTERVRKVAEFKGRFSSQALDSLLLFISLFYLFLLFLFVVRDGSCHC